jgi:predicted DCC family thiol-disulfide oxidoreductase YuxK
MVTREDFSYAGDESVPQWDDSVGLIVFDGVCVFCSTFARFVLTHDDSGRFRFTMAQSNLGESLYRHYRLNPSDFETNLVIMNGRLYEKLSGFTRVMAELGWPWRALAVLDTLPRPIGHWFYDRIATNRYRIFGKYDTCMAPSVELKARLIA